MALPTARMRIETEHVKRLPVEGHGPLMCISCSFRVSKLVLTRQYLGRCPKCGSYTFENLTKWFRSFNKFDSMTKKERSVAKSFLPENNERIALIRKARSKKRQAGTDNSWIDTERY